MSYVENLQRTTDLSGILQLLEISSPSFPDTLYLVNDSKDWTINGKNYIGIWLELRLPTDASGQAGTLDIKISNVGQNMTEDLERLPPGDMVQARLLLSTRDDPGTFFKSIPMPLTNVSLTSDTLTATASMDSVMRQQSCRLRANPFTLPGLF